MLTPLLFSLVAGPRQEPHVVPVPPAPYVIRQLDFRQAGLLDRLCIVEAKGQRRERRATGDLSTGTIHALISEVSIEEGTVIDGMGLAKGASVKLVAFDAPARTADFGGGALFDPRPKFVRGKRYLALAVKAEDDRLFQPYSLDEPGYLKAGRTIASAAPEEVSLLTAFPTEASGLPKGGDSASRLLNALVDALPATGDWHRQQLLELLQNSKGFGLDKYDPHPDTDLTRRLRNLAGKTSDPVLRADAYAVLVSWCVIGSEGPFFNALLAVADSPTFNRDLPINPFFVKPGMPGHPVEYPIVYDRVRANRLAAEAKNETVRHYLFEFAASNPDQADKVRYVRMLDRESPEFIDRVMLRRLAGWDDLPAKKPVMGIPKGKFVQECLNRDELIAFWKGKYPG